MNQPDPIARLKEFGQALYALESIPADTRKALVQEVAEIMGTVANRGPDLDAPAADDPAAAGPMGVLNHLGPTVQATFGQWLDRLGLEVVIRPKSK